MNKAILMGRLTKDPEMRYTATNNVPLCNFTLAIDRRFQKSGTEKQTDFIPIVAWRNLAEFCSKYFQKGLKVVIVGSIQTRNYDDNEGKRHYFTEVIADEAYFAESKRNAQSDGDDIPAQDSGNVNNESKSDSDTDNNDSQQGDGFYEVAGGDDLPF
jgi:single-strand DNA-binding protein